MQGELEAMKKNIIESNRYKRYMYYLMLYGGMYLAIVLMFLFVAIAFLGEPNPTVNPWWIAGIGIIMFSIPLLSFILFYGIKLLTFRINADKYKSLIGVITSIETTQYLRSDHRDVTIRVEGINNLLYAKVYRGDLYDEVATNKKIEIAYNESNGDIIILKVV